MIGSLRGMVAEIHPDFLLLEVGGIGYRVRATIPTLVSLRVGEEAKLYIHDHVREDSHDLFGFRIMDEMSFFERLLDVSGVGPKVALSVLSAGTFDEVRRAVAEADLARLTASPGVGTKTAQKIVLELKGKLVDVDEGTDRDTVEALISLGYSQVQARDAVKAVDRAVTDPSERVRVALKSLSHARR